MNKVEKTMHEFKHGTLHSGSKHGPVVKNREQAVAIALHQQDKADRTAGTPQGTTEPFTHREDVGMNNSDW